MAIRFEGFRRPTTKAEVIEAYQEKYTARGSESWRQHLISDIFTIRYGALNLSAEDAKKKRKNIARRFDPTRRGQEEPRNRQEYKDLGQELPLMRPESIHISGTIFIRYSQDCEEREIDEELTDEDDIKDYMKMMSSGLASEAISNIYNDGDVDDVAGYAPCSINDWKVTIVAA